MTMVWMIDTHRVQHGALDVQRQRLFKRDRVIGQSLRHRARPSETQPTGRGASRSRTIGTNISPTSPKCASSLPAAGAAADPTCRR